MGHNLKISHYQHKPFVMEGDEGSYEGIAMHLMKVLARKFGFDMDLTAEDRVFMELPNGTIVGVIEKVREIISNILLQDVK